MKFNDYLSESGEIGYVEQVHPPIVYVSGLPGVWSEELVVFENGEYGQVMALGENLVEILTFARAPVKPGTRVTRTKKSVEIGVGDGLLGQTVDALCRSVYSTKPVDCTGMQERNVHGVLLGIDKRREIKRPLETGVTVVDLLVPLGRGQRQLVLGDRKIGKTNFLLQSLLTQAKKDTICIYAAIGKQKTDVRLVESFLEKHGAKNKSIIFATTVSDSLGMIYLAPYSAMTAAEYFRDMGKDVLLILDDLTSHARFYREISLIAGRFPGRSSYPGDTFYAHARLLERAGNFKKSGSDDSVSITCLPVAETIEGDISGYIQTNLMSITDGHIFFDKNLFDQGKRPAINYFLSVTRVGRQTQTPVRWGINRELNTFLTLYDKTQSFVHFGAELNENITSTLKMGERTLKFFSQHMNRAMDLNLQIILFCLIWSSVWNAKTLDELEVAMDEVVNKFDKDKNYKEMVNKLINEAKDFNGLLGKVADAKSRLV